MCQAEGIDVVEKVDGCGTERSGGSSQLCFANSPQFLTGHAAGDASFAAGQADEVKRHSGFREFAQQAGGEELIIGMSEDREDRPAVL